MPGHRIVIRRPFRFEYRLPAPMEVRYRVFQMNAVDVPTRLEAISRLVDLGDPAAAGALIEALDDDLAVRVFAAEALQTIVPEAPAFDPHGPRPYRDQQSGQVLRWWRAHRRAVLAGWLRQRLREAHLSKDGDEHDTPALVAALEHENPVLRFHAHRALVRRCGEIVPYDYNWLPSLRSEAAQAWRRNLADRPRGMPTRDE